MFGFGKRKKTDEVPEVDEELFHDLQCGVREALKTKLSFGEIPDTEHGLYILGCFVMFDWDSPLVSLYYITEDQYQKKIQSKPKEHSHIYRWKMAEYGAESICHEELTAILNAYM